MNKIITRGWTKILINILLLKKNSFSLYNTITHRQVELKVYRPKLVKLSSWASTWSIVKKSNNWRWSHFSDLTTSEYINQHRCPSFLSRTSSNFNVSHKNLFPCMWFFIFTVLSPIICKSINKVRNSNFCIWCYLLTR